jgi:hypothetical protein
MREAGGGRRGDADCSRLALAIEPHEPLAATVRTRADYR